MTATMTSADSGNKGIVAPISVHQEEELEVIIARRIYDDPRNGVDGRQWTSVDPFQLISWLRTVVLPAGKSREDGVYVLNSYEYGKHHDILEVFIPEEASAEEGSVHDSLQTLLGVRITHTKDPHTRSCAVQTVKTKLAIQPS